MLVALGAAAVAHWSAVGGGLGAASTGSLNAPTNLVAYSPGGDTVAVSWEAATLGNGQPAAGYYVTRVKDSDGTGEAACGTSGASPTTSLTCNDLAVADGTYHYTVTAQHGSWTATSLASVSVSVNSEQPTVTVTSISPTPNSNGYNNTTPVVVNLSASDASGIASITYRIDAGTPVTVAGATAAVSVPDDGTHTVTFSARDNMGLDSADQYQTVLIDTVLPAAPPAPTLTAASDTGFSDTDNISNDSTPTFTGAAEAGSTVTLYSSGTAVGTAVASDGTYTVTASPLAAGTRTMTVRATDLADNLGPSSGSTSITLDYTAPSTPAAPNLSAASDSGRSSTDNITFETTPTYTMAFPAGAVSGTLLSGGVEVGSSTTATVTSSVLANGVHAMTVRVADAAGNISSASATQTVTIDTTAPAAPTTPVLTAASDTGSSSSDRITNDTTPTFTGSNESLAIVTLWQNGLQLGTTTTIGTTHSVTSDAMSDGDHVVTTTATDVAGNLGPASGSTTVTIDTVPPTAPSAPVVTADSDSGISSTDGITNDTTPTVTGTAVPGINVTLYNGSTPVGSVVAALDGTWTITSTTLTSGSKSLTARTDPDVAGNVGISATSTVTIDVTAPAKPAIPNLSAASDSGRSSTDENTFVTTPTYIIGFPAGTVSGTLLADGVEVGSSTTTTVTSSALADGVYSMTSRAADAAGNISVASSAEPVTIDTAAPAAPTTPVLAAASDTGSSSSDGITNDTTPTFTGSNESLAIVTLWQNGLQLGTTTTIGTTYSVTSSARSNGDHTFTTRATDVAGNLGPSSGSTTITVDTVAPTVSITSFTASAGQSATISGQAGILPGDDGTVTVVLCTQSSATCIAGSTKATLTANVNPSTGAWSVTSGSLGATPTLYARAKSSDLSGNLRTSSGAGPIAIP